MNRRMRVFTAIALALVAGVAAFVFVARSGGPAASGGAGIGMLVAVLLSLLVVLMGRASSASEDRDG